MTNESEDLKLPNDLAEEKSYYWKAINGASCAASSVPMPMRLQVVPTPQQLVGFNTREEQLAAPTMPLNEANRKGSDIFEDLGETTCKR